MDLKKSKPELGQVEMALREDIKNFALDQRSKFETMDDDDDTSSVSVKVGSVQRLFENRNAEKEDLFFGLLRKYFGLSLDFFVVEFEETIDGESSTEPVLVIRRKQVQPMSLKSQCVRLVESLHGNIESVLPIELNELIASEDYLITSEMRSQAMFYFYRYDSVRQSRLLMDALAPVITNDNMREVSRLFGKLLELPWILYSLDNMQKAQEFHEEFTMTSETEAVSTCRWKTFTYEMWMECTFRKIDDRFFELYLVRAQDLNFNFLIRKHTFGIHAEETLVVHQTH